MTLIRLGIVAVLVTLLLSITSCNRFNGPKPTQLVDLPSMIGKSREEITKMVGTPPNKDDSGVVEWELPEGRLSVRKNDGQIGYSLKQTYSGFASSKEMAGLVNIDVQTRKVIDGRGLQRYEHISVNGKTFNLLVILGGQGYYDAIISNFEIGGEVTQGFKPTQLVDLPLMIGKSSPEITKMVGTSPFKEENTTVDWVLPEGRLSVFKNTNFISYNLKSYSDFDPDRGVASPGEMAALVNKTARDTKTSIVLSPRSGRQHKAWGVSPRIKPPIRIEPAERATEFAITKNIVAIALPFSCVLLMFPLSAATRTSDILAKGSWGSAALHPRLYAAVRSADFRSKDIDRVKGSASAPVVETKAT